MPMNIVALFFVCLSSTCLEVVAAGSASADANAKQTSYMNQPVWATLSEPRVDVLLQIDDEEAEMESWVIDSDTGGYSHIKVGSASQSSASGAHSDYETIPREEWQRIARVLNVESNLDNLELVVPGDTIELQAFGAGLHELAARCPATATANRVWE